MIPLDEMIVGFYNGKCRNATQAYWDGERFIYVREKFGAKFLEAIHHPENEFHFDVFIPTEGTADCDWDLLYFLIDVDTKEIYGTM